MLFNSNSPLPYFTAQMAFRNLALSALLFLALVRSHASVPAEDYWRSVWSNTPMPQALKDLVQPEASSTGAKIGNSKLDLDVYNGAASEISVPRRIKDTLNITTYFFEEDLRPGKKMMLDFTKPSEESKFLPHKDAKSIPFSSNKLSEVWNRYGVESKSAEAETIKYTIEVCENPGIKGEDKYCATSLESMIDFTVSKLGKNIQVLSTEFEREYQKQQKYNYSIVEGVKKVGDRVVACHKMNYPYAVFYCHEVNATRSYTVPLVAADGTKVKALAVCHTDTVNWSPKHLAFVVLKVKPGTVPVCHFLATDSLLWAPN